MGHPTSSESGPEQPSKDDRDLADEWQPFELNLRSGTRSRCLGHSFSLLAFTTLVTKVDNYQLPTATRVVIVEARGSHDSEKPALEASPNDLVRACWALVRAVGPRGVEPLLAGT